MSDSRKSMGLGTNTGELSGEHGGDGMAKHWRVRPASADDLIALRGLDGADLAPPALADTVWVAEPAAGADSSAPGAAGPALATVRLRHQIGQPVPRAWFRLGWAVHASAELGLYRRQRTLLLGHDLTGASELTGLGLHPLLPAAQALPAWTVLVQAALLALHASASGQPPERLTDDLHGHPLDRARVPCIVELPGLRDAQGLAPVWQGLGRHFHAQDLDAARRQHGPDWAHHLASLLPRHVLYASLLPAATQAALGQVLAAAQPLAQALAQLGFEPRGHIGITDGGTVLERWQPA